MAADLTLLPRPLRPGREPLRYAAPALLVLLLWVPLRADEPLKSILSEVEYRAAGLDKLTAEERAALLQALLQHGLPRRSPTSETSANPSPLPTSTVPAAAATHPAATPATVVSAPATPAAPETKGLWARIKDFGAEQLPLKDNKDPGEVTEVEAQMTEPFHGLQGRTIFRLDNGQVWQQRIAETSYLGRPIDNPKVILRRTRFGYRLAIPAVDPNFDVSVKRIQ